MTYHNREQDDAVRGASSSAIDMGPLPGFLGYALRRAQLAVFDDIIRTLEPVDLRPAYFSALMLIAENPGLNQSEVSAALGIQRTNFVTMVDHMETRGLVARRASRGDRRSYALHLTQEGEYLLAEARALHARHEARLVEKLGPGGREKLLPLLWKLVG